jgi:hypothetical protein
MRVLPGNIYNEEKQWQQKKKKDIKAYFRKIGKEPDRYAYVDPSLSGKPEKPWED